MKWVAVIVLNTRPKSLESPLFDAPDEETARQVAFDKAREMFLAAGHLDRLGEYTVGVRRV